MIIKQHKDIIEEIEGIKILKEYNYLGVRIDNYGNLNPQLAIIKKRSNYLRANMRFYTHNLSYEN